MDNKIKILQERFPEGVDSFISTDEKTVLYLTGFDMSDGALFVTRDDAVLFVDFRYIEAANEGAKNCRVVMPEKSFYDEISDIISQQGIKTVGFEERKTTVAMLDVYKKRIEGVEFARMSSVITKMAEVKSEYELDLIAHAESIGDAAFADVLPLIKPDMTEIEVALELEYHMRKHGAAGFSFDTIAVSGTASSRPHGVPRNVKLERGFLTMDFGCIYNGYCSDMTRTVCIGSPDAEMKKVYDTVLKAQLAACAYIHDGCDCGEADSVARNIINEGGYAGKFGHSLGHSLGIYIHESPRLSQRGFGEKLTKGHVFSIEPGIYLEGKYGVRIEDVMMIRESGVVNVTHSPKELIII
ncbi:MAG: aminopeptidase P family protein [Ruminococcaceae bacterium]|nr:aminopeptidase P family protein [Oscillospiraceae bacterium]